MNAKLSLPIGSIVVLKNNPKKVMVIGFLELNNGIVYDYAGVFYPEGMVNKDNIVLFNESDIESILTNGYNDTLEKDFKNKLNNYIKNLN